MPMRIIDAGCFGKLPIFGDFIRHNAGGPEMKALDHTLEEGIYEANQVFGGSWSEEFDRAPPRRFIFAPPDTGGFLVGVMAPGRDKVGRRYPFAIFLQGEKASLGDDAALLPVAVEGFLDAAEDLAVKGWSGLDVKGLAERIECLPRDGKRGDLEMARKGPGVPAKNLLDALEMAKATPEGRPMVGLKFPLPGGKAAGASLWMDLVLRLGVRWILPYLTYWWDGALLMSLGRSFPQFLLPLVRPDHEDDRIFDLGAEGTLADLQGEIALRRRT